MLTEQVAKSVHEVETLESRLGQLRQEVEAKNEEIGALTADAESRSRDLADLQAQVQHLTAQQSAAHPQHTGVRLNSAPWGEVCQHQFHMHELTKCCSKQHSDFAHLSEKFTYVLIIFSLIIFSKFCLKSYSKCLTQVVANNLTARKGLF